MYKGSTGVSPVYLRCTPGVHPLYTARDSGKEPSAGAEAASGIAVAADSATYVFVVACAFPGSDLGGITALVALSGASQPLFFWQVAIKTFCPGPGRPNRAV